MWTDFFYETTIYSKNHEHEPQCGVLYVSNIKEVLAHSFFLPNLVVIRFEREHTQKKTYILSFISWNRFTYFFDIDFVDSNGHFTQNYQRISKL